MALRREEPGTNAHDPVAVYRRLHCMALEEILREEFKYWIDRSGFEPLRYSHTVMQALLARAKHYLYIVHHNMVYEPPKADEWHQNCGIFQCFRQFL